MDYIVVQEIGTMWYYGLHCSTLNRTRPVLSTILLYTIYERSGIMNNIAVRVVRTKRYYELHCHKVYVISSLVDLLQQPVALDGIQCT